MNPTQHPLEIKDKVSSKQTSIRWHKRIWQTTVITISQITEPQKNRLTLVEEVLKEKQEQVEWLRSMIFQMVGKDN